MKDRNRRFVINSIPDFPRIILEDKNTIDIQKYIIDVCTHLVLLKETDIELKIREFFSDKIIQGKQILDTGCYEFGKKELVIDLIKHIENKH